MTNDRAAAIVDQMKLLTEPKSDSLMQAIELEETPPPMVFSALVGLICVLIVGFVLWAGATRVEELTRSHGAVMPAGDVIAVSHLEAGLVSQILVQEGEEVRQGQALIQLAPISTEAMIAQLEERRATLVLSVERYEAVADGRAPKFDAVLEGREELKREQEMLYAPQLGAIEKRRSILEKQLEQQRSEQERLQNQLLALQERAALALDEARLRKRLFDDGLTTRDRYYAAQREAKDLEQEVADYRDQLAASKIQVLELEETVGEFDRQTQTELRQTKADLDIELAEVEQRLSDVGGRADRLTLTAPADGIVKGLQVNAVNAVVQSGAQLLEIVPIAERMVVSAQVSPSDIGRVQVGQPASVKVAAYDAASFGALDGVVELVSASTFQDERGDTFYRAVIALDKAYFGDDPKRNRVLPGMSVEADIKNGRKSILTYLLKPVSRGWSNAFHEA